MMFLCFYFGSGGALFLNESTDFAQKNTWKNTHLLNILRVHLKVKIDEICQG